MGGAEGREEGVGRRDGTRRPRLFACLRRLASLQTTDGMCGDAACKAMRRDGPLIYAWLGAKRSHCIHAWVGQGGGIEEVGRGLGAEHLDEVVD